MTRHELNDVFARTSFLQGANATYLAELYAQYQENPSSLDPEWREFFASLDDDAHSVRAEARGPSWAPTDGRAVPLPALPSRAISKQQAIATARDSLGLRMLIRAYRTRGHLAAKLDPLELVARREHPELKPKTYGFTKSDYDRAISIGGALGMELATLRQVLRRHGSRCERLAWIDLHTGLGPSGHGERIFACRDDAAAFTRAKAWWGDVTSFYDGSSTSAVLTGLMFNAAYEEAPQAEYTGIALEYGTLPQDQVMLALRADQWLENHPDAAATASFLVVGKQVNNLPVDRVVEEGRLVRIESQTTRVAFEGRLIEESDELRGTIEVGAFERPLALHRSSRRAS